jgi:hypothetical protein
LFFDRTEPVQHFSTFNASRTKDGGLVGPNFFLSKRSFSYFWNACKPFFQFSALG